MEVQIVIAVLLTSFLSGIIGMGGGLILMGVLGSFLPVKFAMILHGVTQFSANGSRAVIHREHIQWRILLPYFVGSILCFVVLRYLAFIPSKPMVFILLGLFPLISLTKKIGPFFNITRKGRPFLCGVMVNCAQTLAGASGGVLDIFYVNSGLDRHKIVATKALTQTLGHGLKLVYYVSLLASLEELLTLRPRLYILCILCAFLGSYLGKKILKKINNQWFLKMNKVFILVIGFSLLIRGITLIL